MALPIEKETEFLSVIAATLEKVLEERPAAPVKTFAE